MCDVRWMLAIVLARCQCQFTRLLTKSPEELSYKGRRLGIMRTRLEPRTSTVCTLFIAGSTLANQSSRSGVFPRCRTCVADLKISNLARRKHLLASSLISIMVLRVIRRNYCCIWICYSAPLLLGY
jgi:hypothetical protein